MKLKNAFIVALLTGVALVTSLVSEAQIADTIETPQVNVPATPVKKAWYEKLSLRGYAQVRYNRILETNENLKCDQCDKSLGKNNSFFIRRTRIVFSGNVHDRVYIYIQPDFASSADGNNLNFAQLRDAYFDVALDAKKEYRFRIGQSKIPYGFENMQSSQNRLALDRNDAINSAFANERDLGVFFYWAPSHIRERFSWLISSGLKGSGDYGVFGMGVFNGQTANKPEQNDDLHVAARFSYPFQINNKQIIEPGIQAYTGKYVVSANQTTNGVTTSGEFTDERVAASLVVYPQPLGFQTEYNVGRGPEFDPETKSIVTKSLHGGYAQIMYYLQLNKQVFIPFMKVQHYEGGKKHETDARFNRVYETELGVEWQPIPNFELVTMYSIADRTTSDGRNLLNRQHGSRLRLQAQVNF